MPADPTNASLSESASLVSQLADQLGFAIVGIAPAQASDRQDFVQSWLAAGKHGEMHYLANHLEKRLDPGKLLPGAQAVIVVADRYHLPGEGFDASHADAERGASEASGTRSAASPETRGRIARYAWGDDYHKVIKNRLFELADQLRERHEGHEFKITVDTAPTLEREHAQRAGLGWIGKHTLLIHPQLGSYLLLGTIVTTLPLRPSASEATPSPGSRREADRMASGALLEPSESPAAGPLTLFADRVITDHCGTCTRCIDACPTQCITPYQVDGHRCISYLTLEHRSLIDEDLQPQMGDWIAGCDVCQEVCPHNRVRGLKSKIQNPKSQTAAVEAANEGSDARSDANFKIQNSKFTIASKESASPESAQPRSANPGHADAEEAQPAKRLEAPGSSNADGTGYQFSHADAEMAQPSKRLEAPADNSDSTEHKPPHADAEMAQPAKRLEAPLLDEYQPRYPAPSIDLLEILNWTAEDRQRAFTKSALKRIKLPMLKRNAIIAAGNYIAQAERNDPHAATLLERIKHLANDENEDDLVRETARQTLGRIET